MSECRKIDEVLWRYDQLPPAERERVKSHLARCVDCQAALEAIRALGLSSEKDMKTASEVDPQSFDAAVMRKIRNHRRELAHPIFVTPRYSARMAMSFALAAMVVLVLVKSISDLHDSGIPMPPLAEKSEVADTYGMINVELKPADEPIRAEKDLPKANENAPLSIPPTTPEKELVLGEGKQETEKSTETLALIPPPEVASDQTASGEIMQDAIRPAETPTLNAPPMMASKLAPEKPVQAGGPEMMARPDLDKTPGQSKEDVFTILTVPVSAPAPDSISIDAIYVTDESISIAQQSRAAALSEVYTDTGAMQPGPTQSSVLVTIETMPRAIEMGMPEYPIWAKKQELSGTVWVRARVDIAGRVSEAEVISCDTQGAGFEDSALEAAKKSRFVPASSNGINLPVWIVYPVKYIYKSTPR